MPWHLHLTRVEELLKLKSSIIHVRKQMKKQPGDG